MMTSTVLADTIQIASTVEYIIKQMTNKQ